MRMSALRVDDGIDGIVDVNGLRREGVSGGKAAMVRLSMGAPDVRTFDGDGLERVG